MSGWRFFQGKDLPPRDDGTSQKTAFSKCCAVMHALLGKKPEAQECEQDPEFWFKFLWYRLCNNFGWRTDNMWAVSTCYDKLNDQKVKRDEAFRATESPSVAQAAAQATSTAEVGMRSASTSLTPQPPLHGFRRSLCAIKLFFCAQKKAAYPRQLHS